MLARRRADRSRPIGVVTTAGDLAFFEGSDAGEPGNPRFDADLATASSE
jgi:hypothetical protein